jgi:hypothetical protein
MSNEASRARARSIIRTLRAGVPGPAASRAITVGTATIEARISELFSDLVNLKTRAGMLLIEADWGFGKSHVQMLCLDEIEKRRVPSGYERIDGRGSSLAHIHRMVPRLLSGLRFTTANGLMAAVEQGVIGREEALEWCNGHTGTFAENLRLALHGNARGWLAALGLRFAMPDYPYQHPRAMDLLLSAADMLRHVGHHGLVLLLDEVENLNQQYDIRGRRKSYDTLGQLMAHGTIVPILFVTRRFVEQLEADKQRGEWTSWRDWTGRARWFVESLSQIELLRPPVINDGLAKELVQKLGLLHDSAYGDGVALSSVTKNVLRMWRETSTRSVRLLVRLAVNAFDLAKVIDMAHSDMP